jgi:predicted permease
MSAVALAILPVIAAIALGYGLRARGVPKEVWAAAERSVFFLFLPCLIVHHVAIRDIALGEVFQMMVPIVATVLAVGVLGYWSSRLLLGSSRGTAASVHQASIRLNGVVMIAILPPMLGHEVWPYVAVMTSIWPTLTNVTSILVYVRATGANRSVKDTVLAVLKNPVVIAVTIGVGLNISGLGPVIEAFGLFELIGQAALPVGLLSVGAALEFQALRRSGPPSVLATVVKLCVMPLLVLVLCQAVGLPLLVTQLMVISAALPSSPSGYVLASQMGGDAQTMASAITLQHLVGMVSVAVVAGWMLAG